MGDIEDIDVAFVEWLLTSCLMAWSSDSFSDGLFWLLLLLGKDVDSGEVFSSFFLELWLWSCQIGWSFASKLPNERTTIKKN